MPARLNCGLFQFALGYYDLEFIEWLLQRYERLFAVRHHWVEQTCWGAMALHCGGHFWSEEQVCVIRGEESLTEELIGAHFVTPVRGLLPEALARSRFDTAPVAFQTEPMPRLRADELFQEQAAQFLRRRLGRAG